MGGLLRSLPAVFALAAMAAIPALPAVAAMPLSPCHIEGFSEEVLCGTHRVFEDRAARTGRTIDLKVAVVPALRREGAADPLFILAGGPGQGAKKYGALIPPAFREVRKTRDIVLVDLRGTGGSNPLSCDFGDSLEMLEGEDPDTASCLRSLKADPRLYTTEPAVDDLDEVRAALGYERINLWGGSYGTRAALVYARRHPDRMRTVVLDGAAPFEIKLPLHNAWGAQRALGRLVADCAAEPECRTAYPRLREEIAEVFARLDQGPVPVRFRHPRTARPLEMTVTRGVFASGLRGMLYTPAHASLVPWMIRSARQGDFAPFATLTLETAAWSTETMSLGLTLSVLCSEDVHRIRDEDAAREVRGTFLEDFEIAAWRRMCASWPRGPMPVLASPPLRVPALILSGDLDPVTPPRWGEAMKKHFPGALHVVVPGTGHNTSMTGCVPDLIARFVEQGGAEGIDPSCVRKIRRPPFVIDPSGSTP